MEVLTEKLELNEKQLLDRMDQIETDVLTLGQARVAKDDLEAKLDKVNGFENLHIFQHFGNLQDGAITIMEFSCSWSIFIVQILFKNRSIRLSKRCRAYFERVLYDKY